MYPELIQIWSSVLTFDWGPRWRSVSPGSGAYLSESDVSNSQSHFLLVFATFKYKGTPSGQHKSCLRNFSRVYDSQITLKTAITNPESCSTSSRISNNLFGETSTNDYTS